MGDLLVVVDTVCGFGRERDHARRGAARQEGRAGAAVHVAAREGLDGFVAEKVGQRCGGEFPVGARGEAEGVGFEGRIRLRVGEVLFAVKAGARAGGAGLEGVGLEADLAAIKRAAVQVAEPGEVVGDFDLGLGAPGEVFVAAGIGAAGGQGGFDIVVTALEDAGEAQGDLVGDRAADSAFHVGGAERAVGGAGIGVEFVAGFDAFEFQGAGRGVAAEQRALRAAQDFDARGVEDGEAFEDRVLVDDLVIDEGDRLGGVEVEIRVAEAADIGAREDAAEGGFDDQAGHAGGEELDVFAGLAVGGERGFIERSEGDRNVLDVLFALGGGDRHGGQLECIVLRRSFLGEGERGDQGDGARRRHGGAPGTCRFHV